MTISAKCPGLTPFPSHIVKNLQDAYSAVERGESSTSYKPSSLESWKEEEDGVRRKSIRERAMTNKNAVYRGNKKVKAATDLDIGDS